MLLEPKRLLESITQNEHAVLAAQDDDKLTPTYIDTVGVRTIGFGTTRIGDKPITKDQLPITKRVATQYLKADLYQAILDTEGWLGLSQPLALSATRWEVIIELCYQIGLTRLRKFKKLKAAITSSRYEDAACEIWNSKVATQTTERTRTHAIRFQTNKYDTTPYESFLFVNPTYQKPGADPHLADIREATIVDHP